MKKIKDVKYPKTYVIKLQSEFIYCDAKKIYFFDCPYVQAEDIETQDMDSIEINDKLFEEYDNFLSDNFSVIQYKKEHAENYWDEIKKVDKRFENELRNQFIYILKEKFSNAKFIIA